MTNGFMYYLVVCAGSLPGESIVFHFESVLSLIV